MEPTSPIAAGEGATAAPAAPTEWYGSFNSEVKGYIQNKGFTSAEELATSYQNLEKLHGVPKERLLTLPEDLNSEEASAVWERLGTPKDPEGYQLEVPEETGDKDLAEWAKKAFHKHKVPRQMAEGFIKEYNEYMGSLVKESSEARSLQLKEQLDGLKKDWGSAYEQNKTIADNAGKTFGITDEELRGLGASIGPAAAMRLLHKIGSGTGEAGFVVGGGPGDAQLAPDQAQNQIKSLLSDTDFRTRLQNGEHQAKEKWDRLHKFAYPGQTSL